MTKSITPFVTVVIPTLNEVQRIEACLESVMAQDYPLDRLEVLVVDGRSTDATREKVAAFAERYPLVRLVDNPKRIQAAAFNLGVRESRGEIIIRMDAHAVYSCDYIRRCVGILDATGVGDVGGIWNMEAGSQSLIGRSIRIVNISHFGTGGARFRTGGSAGPVDHVPFGAFRKEVLQRVGPMDERLVRDEDNELIARIRRGGMVVYFDPGIQATYFVRPALRSLLFQMWASGFYHPLAMRINRSSCSVRHFVPAGFVLALLVCAIGGGFFEPLWWIGGGVLVLYLLVDLLASVYAAWRSGWAYLVVLPWLFFLVHVTYGLGTLAGIVRFGFVPLEPAEGKR